MKRARYTPRSPWPRVINVNYFSPPAEITVAGHLKQSGGRRSARRSELSPAARQALRQATKLVVLNCSNCSRYLEIGKRNPEGVSR